MHSDLVDMLLTLHNATYQDGPQTIAQLAANTYQTKHSITISYCRETAPSPGQASVTPRPRHTLYFETPPTW
jgi:hypothetical protein